MMRFSRCAAWALGVVIAVATSSSCGGGGGGSAAKSTLLSPTRWGTFEHFDYVDNTTGGLEGEGMFTLLAGGLESVLVGWEHFYDPPLRVHNHIYSGAVLFNVAQFQPGSGKTITKATLTYHVDTGLHAPILGFFETDAMLMRVPTIDTWHGVPEVFPGPAEPPSAVYPFGGLLSWATTEVPVGLLGGTVDLDITDIVTAWADASQPNRGLLFRSNDAVSGTGITDSDQWWQILRDFTIQVEYATP